MISKEVELGNKIELIKKSKLKEKQHSFFSSLQEIIDDDKIVIGTPIEQGKIIPLKLNDTYILSVYTKRGLYCCEAEVIERSNKNNFYTITLKIKTKMEKNQRREFYRFNCILNFLYKKDENDKWCEGTILDISGGGIRFTSNEKLSSNEFLMCHIILNTENEKKHLYIYGKIIDNFKIDKDLYETRVEFQDISNEIRESIIKFIFNEERKKRKREKGM